MRKNYIHLIPATLLLIFSACQSVQNEGTNTPDYRIENSSLEHPLPFIPTENFTQESDASPEVWDTSNVDISEIASDRKLIAFTFDDAPSKTLESIFAVFAEFNEKNPTWQASATIFFNSRLFDEQTPHLLHTACALGFELGNHTHSHRNLTTLSKEEIREEIDRTDSLLAKVDGQKRHLLRAPFGRTNDDVKSVAYTPLVDWTIDTLDWAGKTAEEIYDSVFYNRFSGAIVLMHDGYPPTVYALKRLLPDLMADGYQAVSVSKMSKAHSCQMKKGSTYIRLRKQR